MRWPLVCSSVVLAATAAAGPRVSNPAFLGVEMRNPGGGDPCVIGAAIPGGPAAAAGLRAGDVIVGFAGERITSCAMLLDQIARHAPGEVVPVRTIGAAGPRAIAVQLSTRDALLGAVIGKPVGSTHLIAIDSGEVFDLSARHGQTAILGLYNPACVECAAVFGRLSAWARGVARRGGPAPLVLALALGDADELHALQRELDVPVVTGALDDRDDGLPARELLLSDRERLGVIVVDGRGTLQYVGPIAPTSDDADAVFDEVIAAAEHAVRRSR